MRKVKKVFFGIVIGTILVYQFIIFKNFEANNSDVSAHKIENEMENVPDINWDSVPKLTEKNSISEDIEIEGEVAEVKTPTAEKAETIDESAFENCYVYSTLTEEDKLLYNEIYTTMMNHKEKALLTTKNLDKLERIYYAIDADHGDIYWVNGYTYIYYTTNDEITDIEFSPTYIFDENEVNMYNKLLSERINLFLSGASSNMADYEKSKYVYETLIHNIDYDLEAEYNQTILSSLLYGKTVCKGYACAAQCLLEELGIPSVIIGGYANGETHAWNAVKLDGEWYYFDTTWGNSKYQMPDETVGKYVDYTYLNMTEDEIRKTHTIDVSFELPICNSMNDNYFVKEGKYITEFDADYIGSILSSAWEKGQRSCNIQFCNQEIYNSAIEHFIQNKHITDYCKGIRSYSYLENRTSNVITINFD